MRPVNVRLGALAAAILFVFPCSTLAQTATSTDAAIAELRQLLADQGAALDRQAQLIDEQGRRLAALQERIEGVTTTTTNGRGSAHGLLAHREPLEHRASDAESERADASVHRKRLRRRRPDDEASARVSPDEPLCHRPDMVHVLGSGGRRRAGQPSCAPRRERVSRV